MSNALKVLVHGTGFAGQGHAAALRALGAEVVGMVGRTPDVVKDVTATMSIPYGGMDWGQALEDCRPDIVSIGTPGGAHFSAIKDAIAYGAHIFVDKPMATTGAETRELFDLAQAKGIKTAFAASFRYMPQVIHAKRLVEEGVIGEPQEAECISHFQLEKDIPFGWSHRREDGGGRLNNNFTHKLSIVTSILGETILAVSGDVRDDLGRAPIVDGVHNFKTRREHIPDDLNAPSLLWGESNVEWSYTVLARLKSAMARKPVSVLFKHGGLQPRFNEDHIALYGSEGAIYIKGHYGSGPLYVFGKDKTWKERDLPADIAARAPKVKGDTEQCWHYLMREFLHDIRGEASLDYPTFDEGSRYQQIIDIIRKNDCWVDVQNLTAGR